MDVPTLDLPNASATAQMIHQRLAGMPQSLFAVMDGGLFDDLPSDLESAGISSRSLFHDDAGAGMLRAGPWLISLADSNSRLHVERLSNQQPCAVYWSCPEGEEALWKHLRTINEIVIPDDRVDGATSERVLFRHWDPNVMASVLPILDEAQFARIFGPATNILMNAPDYGGVKQAPRPADLPPATPGPLRIAPDQIERLKEVMLHSSRLRIARYLKGNIPSDPPGITDEFAWGATLATEKTADELGIRTERGRARWGYLSVISDNKVAEFKETREFIQNGQASPDEQVQALMKDTIAALREYDPGTLS